jgi:hypothetical protein
MTKKSERVDKVATQLKQLGKRIQEIPFSNGI